MLAQEERGSPVAYAVRFSDGGQQVNGNGEPTFTISIPNQRDLDAMLRADDYTAALGFVRGDFDISGPGCTRVRVDRSAGKPTAHGCCTWQRPL